MKEQPISKRGLWRPWNSEEEQTVVLVGVASVLLVTVLYIALGFAPDIHPSLFL